MYHTLKGNKPDFHLAMNGEAAKSFYEEFLSEMKKQYAEDKIKDGIFAALMQVIPFLKLSVFLKWEAWIEVQRTK